MPVPPVGMGSKPLDDDVCYECCQNAREMANHPCKSEIIGLEDCRGNRAGLGSYPERFPNKDVAKNEIKAAYQYSVPA
jgi:hypothetical protein